MAASSRRKGLRGEWEVAQLVRKAGHEVRGLEAAGDWLCLMTNGRTLHIEVKRQERLQLPLWLRQAAADAPAGAVPIVAHRQSRGQWYATLPLADLLDLLD